MSIWEGAEIISVYTREQAIEDGVLVDVSETAREAGVTFPVALTAGVWAECVSWLGDGTQDETGRLWDVVWLLSCAARGQRQASDRVDFSVSVRQRNGRQRIIDLYALCGPGDDMEPVITVMLPHED